jgi:tetratricopeptide (TPR) repeat protein
VVLPDPTLARAAEGVATWRRTTGAPADVRVFPTHPDVGHYLAWYAPGERYFLDSRLSLFSDVADEFATLSRSVGVLPGGGDRSEEFRARGIGAVVLYDPDPVRMTQGLRATAGSGRWAIVRIDGAAVLIVANGSPFASPRFDPERATFGGQSELPVPGANPPTLSAPGVWDELLRPRLRTGSWEASASTIYLRLFEDGAGSSPALPLLAVRAARAGAEIDPVDPTAWLALGRAYILFGARTWEREAGSGFALIEYLRFVQATGALVQAARLNPASASAHETLAGLFLRQNVLDLAYRHAAESVRLVRRAGPVAGESAEAFAERSAKLAAQVDSLEAAVQDAENRFLVHTAAHPGEPLARARVAADLGLKQKAIDVLQKAHPDLYGSVGLGLLADLLLQTGQLAECRVLLDRVELRDNPHVLGYHDLPRRPDPDGRRRVYRLHKYDWLDLCQSAAAGRYRAAGEAIDRLCARLDAEERAATPPFTTAAAVVLGGEVGLSAPPIAVPARLVYVPSRLQAADFILQAKALSAARADLMTIAGILELERGAVHAAADRFGAALKLFAGAKTYGLARPGEALAVRYNEVIHRVR